MLLQPPNLQRLSEYEVVSVDVETTGVYWYRDALFGVAVAAWSRDVGMRSGYWDLREQPQIKDVLRDQLPQCKLIVNHNIKFDSLFLWADADIILPEQAIECTSVRAALINEHEPSFSLDALSNRYLKKGKLTSIYQKLADIFGGEATREVQMKNLHRAPASIAGEYATWDPALAIELWQWQETEIQRQELDRVWTLEKQLTPMIIDVEKYGIRVDLEATQRDIETMDDRVAKAQERLNWEANRKINPNSPPQMREMFGVRKDENQKWCTDSGFILENTETGAPSIDAAALRALAARGDKRAQSALDIRKLVKAKSFLVNHIMGHEVGGRVYPNYNQTRGENEHGTGTGRFSIDDPAMQQIPKRDEDIAAIVRSKFLPEEGQQWGCADWDQFEFRWFAHFVNSPKLNGIYEANPDTDFHQMLADLTGLPRTAKFAGQSANAKQINLGLVFGMGKGRMAAEMGLPFYIQTNRGQEQYYAGPEAEKVFAQYHEAVPGVQKILTEASAIAKSRGYVRTIAGRHIRFPGGKFTHKAGGLVFQGSSADCMKQKMIELWNMSRADGDWRYVLSVHDESDTSLPLGDRGKKIGEEIKHVLETFDGEACPIKCRIPIRASCNVGPNWWEACK